MFKPKRVLFEKGTLDTEVGQNIYNMIKDDKNIEVIKLTSNKIKGNIPGENLFEQYREGKETMVVSYKKSLKFQTCKPSANYQLPLVSGCMGRCGDLSSIYFFACSKISSVLTKTLTNGLSPSCVFK